MPYKATIESTLRNFQYNYIHRIIATNKYLFKCKLSNSNLCDFCSENIETIEHLFWECKHIQPIWNQLVSFLEQQQLNVKLSFLNPQIAQIASTATTPITMPAIAPPERPASEL
ncbi:hypothetical protein DPMN_162584 [Dreissena polymorpha]|uniref:Reverse transcriptase zinc-binding domain-containing protein n=1 Tax=Dreissena polymorpha TaxID=45954 RepID=A0A9D4IUG6_DREPO|nr:hypothetical protein DPMN_162584 [Dreissena polymorpha]